MKIHLKVDLEAALGHFVFDFNRFGEWHKKHEFLMLLRWPKNSKIAPEMAPMMISRPRLFAEGVPPAARGPCGGHARAIAISLRNKGKGIRPKAWR